MKPPPNKNKGIEITRWKVGEADEFQRIDNRDDTVSEPSSPESYEADTKDDSIYNNNPPSEAEQDLIDLYKKRTGETLNPDDAKAATENIVGFFKTLSDWDSKDKPKDGQESPKNLP